jgi:alkylation response protein AidB-like acyl-CoA dehydrogenase
MQRSHYEPEHDEFRRSVRAFIDDVALPGEPAWREAGIIDREYFRQAAAYGLLGLDVDEADGGQGKSDYRYVQVILEEFEYAGIGPCCTGINLQNDIVAPYLKAFASDEQRGRWLSGLCRGEVIGALAITEPGTGSDVSGVATTAVVDGDGYRVNGLKTYIGCGMNADVVLTVVRTDPEQRHRGLSLLAIEAGTEGFSRRNLPRAGREAQDVAELTFDDVWVPRDNLIGEPGAAFGYLMHNLPRERLQVAVSAVAASRYMFELALDFAKERQVFGKAVGSHQHNKFVLAEMATEISMAEVYVDRCAVELLRDALAPEEAAKAKWWCSEMQVRIAGMCFQLHGARGYMDDTPMSRAWREARVTTIYAGTTEIMKEIIGRSLGL